MKSFGDRIDMLIDEFGVAFLVEETGISQSQLYRLRREERDTTRENLIKLSDATNVNLLWLATGKGNMKNNGEDSFEMMKLTSNEIELLDFFRKASLTQQAKAINALIGNQESEPNRVVVKNKGYGGMAAGRDINTK